MRGLRGRAQGTRVAPVGGLSSSFFVPSSTHWDVGVRVRTSRPSSWRRLSVRQKGNRRPWLRPVGGKGAVRSGLIHAGPGRCPRPRCPSRAGFPAGGSSAPVPASFVPCASPPRLIRTQVTRDQGPPLFTHGICKALFLNKFPSRGHQGQGQGQHSLWGTRLNSGLRDERDFSSGSSFSCQKAGVTLRSARRVRTATPGLPLVPVPRPSPG